MMPNGEATLNNHDRQEDEGNAIAGAETGPFGRVKSKLFVVQINHAADIWNNLFNRCCRGGEFPPGFTLR